MNKTGYKLYAIQGIPRDLKDKSTAITFNTLELSTKDFQLLRDLKDAGGELVFIPEGSKELAKVNGKASSKKRPSYQLRIAMLNWYSNKHGNLVGFQDFYEMWINKKKKQFEEAT